MNEEGREDLQNLLKEGIAALIEMRKGVEHSLDEMRKVYIRGLYQYKETLNINMEKEFFGKHNAVDN
ncbi:MAG: hypothetical protein IBX72_02520 [Nitrospirae bacterium]|jgi:hypothetical protein|nr:hypothetical protein [Nitrospirota bacterium]